MNPLRLAIALIVSMTLGSIFLIISVPHYYDVLFSIDKVLSPAVTPVESSLGHTLLFGIMLGGNLSVIIYNLVRSVQMRYLGNLLLAITLSFFLLFLLPVSAIFNGQAHFYLNSNDEFIYLPIIIGFLCLHVLCLGCIQTCSSNKRLPQQLIGHMAYLGLAGILLLTLAPTYAHIFSYLLMISSAVLLMGSTLHMISLKHSAAPTVLLGLGCLFLPFIVLWPSLVSQPLISVEGDTLFVLLTLLVSATVISIGLLQSHRQQLEQRAIHSHANATAETERRAKAELLAKISHEIRTPLSGVLGMTSLLLDTPLSNKQRDYAQTIQGSGHELLGLINTILDISCLESAEMPLGHTAFNPADVLQECSQAFSSSTHAQQVELTVFLQPQVPETLLGDPVRLRQILVSLLKNSFQRTQAGEVLLSVTLNTQQQPEQLVFTIHDTGQPLSASERYQLEHTKLDSKDLLSTSFIGSHLGIIVARQLIELMGGQFTIQDSGQGTVFSFNITLQAQAKITQHSSNDLMLRNKHILIIDSNALSQKVLAQQCSDWGLLVSTCSAATEAVALLRNKSLQGQIFSAILISETSLSASAISFAVRIKEDPLLTTDTTLIMLTSSSNTDLVAARNAGISQVLMKPVSGSTLKVTLLNAMQQGMSTPQSRRSLVGKRVLVAEDNAISVKVISGLLSKLGVQFDIAENGQVALELLQKNSYDLVLMDCEMPVMDGFSAAQKQREYEVQHGLPAIPIIALSAHVLEEHQARAIRSGMNDHLAKPIEFTQLQAILSHNSR